MGNTYHAHSKDAIIQTFDVNINGDDVLGEFYEAAGLLHLNFFTSTRIPSRCSARQAGYDCITIARLLASPERIRAFMTPLDGRDRITSWHGTPDELVEFIASWHNFLNHSKGYFTYV